MFKYPIVSDQIFFGRFVAHIKEHPVRSETPTRPR